MAISSNDGDLESAVEGALTGTVQYDIETLEFLRQASDRAGELQGLAKELRLIHCPHRNTVAPCDIGLHNARDLIYRMRVLLSSVESSLTVAHNRTRVSQLALAREINSPGKPSRGGGGIGGVGTGNSEASNARKGRKRP